MQMASTSLVMASLTPKTFFSNTQNLHSLLFTTPFSLVKTSLNSVSFNWVVGKRFEPLTSRFLRNVAVSSEYAQEEEIGSKREQDYPPNHKLFVGNLPFNVDSAQLADLFANAGTVEMVQVFYDKPTGRSRGFGFVTMSSVEEVEAAAKQFNGYELEGRPLRVNAGPPPAKRDDFGPRGGRAGGQSFDNSNCLYVGNLSWEVDDSALKNLFSELGDVVEARVIFDRDSGCSKGFGFVTYKSADEVNNAIAFLDGVDFKGKNIRVFVAETKPRRSFVAEAKLRALRRSF